jgi:hypothetical protein
MPLKIFDPNTVNNFFKVVYTKGGESQSRLSLRIGRTENISNNLTINPLYKHLRELLKWEM